MNCFFHPEEEAVASCIDCGKGLCKTCAAKYEIAVCDDCNARRNSQDKNVISILFLTRILPSIVLFVIVLLISKSFFIGYYAMGIPWGWPLVEKVLGRRRFTLNGGIMDAFYWAAMLVFSVALGGILFPIEVTRLIIAHIRAKKIDSDIAHNSTGDTNGMG
jgi:hypothetical protein